MYKFLYLLIVSKMGCVKEMHNLDGLYLTLNNEAEEELVRETYTIPMG